MDQFADEEPGSGNIDQRCNLSGPNSTSINDSLSCKMTETVEVRQSLDRPRAL